MYVYIFTKAVSHRNFYTQDTEIEAQSDQVANSSHLLVNNGRGF